MTLSASAVVPIPVQPPEPLAGLRLLKGAVLPFCHGDGPASAGLGGAGRGERVVREEREALAVMSRQGF